MAVAKAKTVPKSKQKYPQEASTDSSLLRSRTIQIKNETQKQYVQAIEESDIVICKGPAGTGKTFLAINVAIKKLVAKEVSKIILTRPIVEAGEELGFLPGTLEEKCHPYLLPLYDAIEFFVGPAKLKALLEDGIIEIAPLAYMRGRTMRNCLTADATVLLASGDYIGIEELVKRSEEGEKFLVKSYNHDLEKVEDSEISFAFGTESEDDLYEIELEDGTIIKMTEDHKLFTKEHGYVEAKNLKIGSTLQQIKQILLEDVKIKSIKKIKPEKVYDITVPGNHNFFTTNGILSHNCIVIADECQNMTQEQMKMLLTRISTDCKMIINGDTQQTDIKSGYENALNWAYRKLAGVSPRISNVEFRKVDIVRHPLIETILTNLESPD